MKIRMKKPGMIVIASILIAGAVAMVSVNRDKLHFLKTERNNGKGTHKKVPKKARIADLKTYMNGIHMRFGATKSPAPANYLYTELQKVRNATGKLKSAKADVEWIHRGPSNVGGRTRGLIVDPDDATHKTWFAGSATGGVWKTTDAGATWECLTDDLPYQATICLAMAKTNHDIIYMGTGESFTYDVCGGGIFKSIDRGETWEHLASTANNEDFRFVNRIEVDPDNEDIVLAATTTGIFKSIDGGDSWTKTFASQNSVEDLVADTSDFNYMFAGVNAVGVFRSTNAGDTWENVTNVFKSGFERIELAISPVNTQKIYASVQMTGETASSLYTSWDRGNTWQRLINTVPDAPEEYNYLGGQGFYDNTIAAHPYDENVVFWGGVNLWKATLTGTTQDGSGSVTEFDTINTFSFLEFIDFEGLFPGMNTGDQEDGDEDPSDYVSIEIRFGPGMTQKAHRFYVPAGATSGVPYTDYTYQDYVDVPFEVWDVTNNRQLMCSFRDQERDGEFNLYERTGEDYGELGREYIFINAVPYSASTPDPNIAVTGGRSYKLIYFFWPTLAEGGTWDPDNLPDSKIYVEWSIIKERLGTVENVTDAYNSFKHSGGNNYDQAGGIGKTAIPGYHPDNHEIYMIPVNDVTEDFWILTANDGGMGISYDQGDNFTQIKRRYLTTQFYGVAKKPYRNEYIGGMQDNGTWQSPKYINASLDTGFYFRIKGDGFEVIWNKQDTERIMGSVYYNQIYLSTDHGGEWVPCDNGIADEDGPFITRLSPVPSNNKIIFAVGKTGIYKTASFGIQGWRPIAIGTGWNIITDEGPYKPYWHHVEVSPANEQIVWAGAGMYTKGNINLRLFVSDDQGTTFEPVSVPEDTVPAPFSGFEVHPTEENTAFALYGLYGYPKILRTKDRGETWEDITQVGEDGVSDNGFPNVGVYSLMVFPDSINKIWAGTEIGIMESIDTGATWHYLESNLPSVAIWQIFAQDNQVVASTYGRGIWTYQYGPEVQPPVAVETAKSVDGSVSIYPNPSEGEITVNMEGMAVGDKYLLSVFSLNGKQVLKKEFIYSGSPEKIDLSALNKGNYIVNITSANINYSNKLVLQ